MNKRFIDILAQVFNLRQDQINEALAQDNLNSWDSLKQMDLITTLEREFNIRLEIQDIIKMTSVAHIMDVLVSKGINLGT
jgi:acyl carrier protein